MALNAGTVQVSVVPDTTGFAPAMQKQMDSVAAKLSVTSGKLRQVGTRMTQAITLPILAVGGISLKAASDLNEAMTATNVTFGKSAKAIQEWSKTTATSIGLSRTEALEGARGFGAMLDTAGVATQKLAPMSKQMVILAADMASFNNQDPSEMLERLRSGLAGEAEPLRRFGVFLSEAAVQSYAFKNGIAAQGAELTEQQKVQARYGIILEQTTKQQGDFARTSDGVANQSRILQAQFKDTAAALGKALLPIAQAAAEILKGLLDRFSGLSKGTQRWILIIGGIAAIAGPVIGAIGAIGGALAFLAANPIVLIIAAVVALTVLIVKNWDKIKEWTLKVFNAVKDFLVNTWRNIKNTIADVVGGLLAFLVRAWANFLEFFFKIAGGIIDAAAKAFGWVPIIGKKIERFKDDFHRTTERIVSDLRAQADEFQGWGEHSRKQLASTTAAVRKFQDTLKETGSYLAAGLSVKLEVQTGGGGGLGPGMGLVAIGQRLQAGGFSVAGHPSFPPIGGHVPGSYHYLGRAIDVNWPDKGAEPGKLAALAGALRASLGGRIKEMFWPGYDPVGGHSGSNAHLHLAMDRGGLVRGPATVHIGDIKEDVAFIPRTGPGAGMRIVGTLDTPFGPSMIDARVVDVLERNVRAVGPR